MVYLSNAAGYTATVSPHGAQVLSWRSAVGGNHLYCSPQDALPGRAVRGGIPVCFPQFSNCGPLTKHGFARTSVWQLDSVPVTGPDVPLAAASFSLSDSPLTRAVWPFGFTLVLQVQLGEGFMECRLNVSNSGADAFEFTAALHTYLAVDDVLLVAVSSLLAVDYLDELHQDAKTASTVSLLQIRDEVDRTYLNTPTNLELLVDDQAHMRIEQSGFADTVVWNPGPAKAASLGDMPMDDWRHMLCIEAAQIEHPVQLLPGAQWHGSQRLTLIASTHN